MILATITHDVRSNTLEVLWLEEVLDAQGTVISYTPAARRNYSPEQKAEFLADVTDGQKYTDMAMWP